jgi:hypothetical protein
MQLDYDYLCTFSFSHQDVLQNIALTYFIFAHIIVILKATYYVLTLLPHYMF